jgi:hypothetical protein
MEINRKDISLNLLVVDPDTGEHLDVDTTMSFNKKYYTIKKLNFKGCIMKMKDVQVELCISKQATNMFWVVVDNLNKENELRDLSQLARSNDLDLRSLQRMIKKMKDIGFLSSTARGVYKANPFIVVGKAVKSSKDIQRLQQEWR